MAKMLHDDEAVVIWGPRVVRLADRTLDKAQRFAVTRVDGTSTVYAESWRPSWGAPPDRWPSNVPLTDESPTPRYRR